MDSVQIVEPVDSGFKNNIILILAVLLGLSFLGINILAEGGDLVQLFTNTFGPLISQILKMFGYTAGNIINKSADVAADAAKIGIDIAEGTVHDVGNLLIPQNGSGGSEQDGPMQDNTESPIQNSIASNKMNWCLVGDYEGKRGCVSITDADKCLSGQMYPSQQICINPNFSPNLIKMHK